MTSFFQVVQFSHLILKTHARILIKEDGHFLGDGHQFNTVQKQTDGKRTGKLKQDKNFLAYNINN